MSRTPGKSAMYFRMLWRAAVLRKGQAAAALAAVIVAAAAATAMLNLYVDVQTKLRKEFRKFGANIVVEAKTGETFTPDAIKNIASTVGGRGLAVPFAYAVARTDKDQPIVVAGTNISAARQLNPWWSVTGWPNSDDEALVGVRAAQLMNLNSGSPFTLTFQGRQLRLSSAGTIHTGAGEDSQIYISLPSFRAWTGIEPSVVEVSEAGSSQDISAMIQDLRSALPFADVRAVRQVTEGEANILGKTRSTLLWSSAFIVLIAALCVLATLMGWVFDRRRDFAIMKALGASDRLIAAFVSGEAAILGLTGGVIGFAAGFGIAEWIGRANFHAPVALRLSVLPTVLLACLIVTLVATLLPLRLLRAIQPAMILRGE
jgi:putative ABC transport system permease protein